MLKASSRFKQAAIASAALTAGYGLVIFGVNQVTQLGLDADRYHTSSVMSFGELMPIAIGMLIVFLIAFFLKKLISEGSGTQALLARNKTVITMMITTAELFYYLMFFMGVVLACASIQMAYKLNDQKPKQLLIVINVTSIIALSAAFVLSFLNT